MLYYSPIVTGFVALVLVGVDSIPAVLSIADRVWGRSPRPDDPVLAKTTYRDEDGHATEESLRAFSDRWQRITIALLSASGLAVTTSLAIFTTSYPNNIAPELKWLQLGIWVLLSIQAVAFFTEPRPTSRFTLGQFAFGGSIIAVAVSSTQIHLTWTTHSVLLRNPVWLGLISAQVASGILRALFTVLLPRRPDVYFEGQLVDREHTVSAFGRYTFSWASNLLDFTLKSHTLELTDLPKLRAEKRADQLRAHFEQSRGSRKVWKALIFAHWQSLLLQFTLCIIIGILSFGPQMALFNILDSLEARGTDSWQPYRPWLWVTALGSLMLLCSTIEAWLFWAVCSKLGVPIYAELSAAVFAKSMRRKDAKHTRQKKPTDKLSPDASAKALLADQNEEDEDDEASVKKSRQSIVNLAAVDARRISDFTSYAYLVPFASLKVIIGCTFLVQILGWRSALAGLSVSALVTPLNIYAAKRFTRAQDKLMKLRDSKVAIVTEALQGIRQVKFSALEEQWQQKIGQAREKELGALWISFLYDVVLMSIWILGPVGLSAVSLTVYALIHRGLSASVAFTAMSVFGALEMSLAILPEIISDGLEAKVSADRIDVYMAAAEKTIKTIAADHIAFDDATVAWPTEEEPDDEEAQGRFALLDLNLKFPQKGLSVISGRTGSGKSLLLISILGECDILQGTVKVPAPPAIKDRFDHRATSADWIIDSAIAYVAQIPWIENATIKENVLFGLPYHEARYQKVLFACALQKDLEMLPDGDLTDIGANGVNLSGGQRWRVSFARALYSRAGILIMDDIFSALDAHTGRHLYEHALTGELGLNRTRILVTHHVGLCLPRTDYSVLLENGYVKYAGTTDELQKSNHLQEILREENASNQADGDASSEEPPNNLGAEMESSLQKVVSNTSHPPPAAAQNGNPNGSQHKPKKYVEDERREVGSVKLSVYQTYLSMGGHGLFWGITILVYLSYSALMVGRAWWVNIWTSSSSSTQTNPDQFHTLLQHTMIPASSPPEDDNLPIYLGVYIGMSALACIVGTLRFYFILKASVRASRNLFGGLVYAVLRAPLRWLDTVPLGRIINRFTADFHQVDSRIGYELGFFVAQILDVCGIMLAGILVSPAAILFAVILLLVCLRFSITYLHGAREIKRLESTAKSPVFEQFWSSLTGLVTIRAFSKSDTFIEVIYSKINAHAQAWWGMWLFNRWLGIRMNLVGAIFTTLTAALVVYLPGISASLAGFALSFALQCNTAITYSLRQYANIELNMNATERVIEYSNIELENQGGADAPAAWPTEGRLEVHDLVVGYAPELPSILKGLSFTVEKNQRVGVVGRTGAGKSSLTLALFRFLEARQGQILIDGLDVSKLKLHDLRSRLAIIPQDPVLFSGTVRTNLDPFDEYSDSELYDALARVHLISASLDDDETLTSQAATPRQPGGTGANTPGTATPSQTNANVFTSLEAPISEGGLNLSQGQRQLLCLARAIVARPKLMVLDEATSAVDMETDALIQQSIRSEFGRNATTLLVIAHRLSTIADFDRILVLDAGKAVEFGAPRELMGIEDGVFKNLVDHSGEKAVLEKMIFG